MSYFIAPEALIADEAAMPADEAASIADVAADDAAMEAEVASVVVDGVVMTVVEGIAGVVVVVVVSSFLVQAAKVTAAASVAINRAVLMFLLDLGSDNYRSLWEPLFEDPRIQRHRTLAHSMPDRRL
ncbi:MAG: hypothetical protein M3Z29_11680 [Pseudomonadota bacterium]|nr:hypothetical protein [Pseudomonadota bacterium]